MLAGQVLIREPWSLAIYGKEASAPISWTMDSSLLKGFWCASSGHVPDLWFCGVRHRLRSPVKLKVNVVSSAHALAARLVVFVHF